MWNKNIIAIWNYYLKKRSRKKNTSKNNTENNLKPKNSHLVWGTVVFQGDWRWIVMQKKVPVVTSQFRVDYSGQQVSIIEMILFLLNMALPLHSLIYLHELHSEAFQYLINFTEDPLLKINCHVVVLGCYDPTTRCVGILMPSGHRETRSLWIGLQSILLTQVTFR